MATVAHSRALQPKTILAEELRRNVQKSGQVRGVKAAPRPDFMMALATLALVSMGFILIWLFRRSSVPPRPSAPQSNIWMSRAL